MAAAAPTRSVARSMTRWRSRREVELAGNLLAHGPDRLEMAVPLGENGLRLLAGRDVPDDAQEHELPAHGRAAGAHLHREGAAVPAAVHGFEEEALGPRLGQLGGGQGVSLGRPEVVDGEGQQVLPGIAVGRHGGPVRVDDPLVFAHEEHDVARLVGHQAKPLQGRLDPCPVGQLALGRVVELGVLQGDGGLVGEGAQVGDLVRRIAPRSGRIEDQDAEEPARALHRQPQVGDDPVGVDMGWVKGARVVPRIGDRQRLPGDRHLPGEAAAHRNGQAPVHVQREAHAHPAAKELRLFLQEEQPDDGRGGNRGGLLDDRLQNVRQVQRGPDRLIGAEERRESGIGLVPVRHGHHSRRARGVPLNDTERIFVSTAPSGTAPRSPPPWGGGDCSRGCRWRGRPWPSWGRGPSACRGRCRAP